MLRKNKSKLALVIANSSNEKLEELSNTTIGDLTLRVESIENLLSVIDYLVNDIENIRSEINIARNQTLNTLESINQLASQINIQTISNQKTALQIQTISTRLSIEIANSEIQIQ